MLSKVDWRAKGLSDLGRPDGFHERQVDRWTGFFERIKGREIDRASTSPPSWLRTHRPLDFIPGVMHGDYQFANVMYLARRPGSPCRDRRLGDGHRRRSEARPRWMVQSWPEDTDAADAAETSYVDMHGMPSRSQLVEHYAKSRAARSTTSTTT